VIEYGEAKRITVASGLKELKLQELPWIILSKENGKDFSEAILIAHKSNGNSKWDKTLEKFSWKNGANQIEKTLKEIK
jgi:hypothetical protein